jgi:hypothetical protein
MEAHTDDYDYINEESIHERLKCTICCRPFVNPVSTKCKDRKHTFCRQCIEEWIKRDPSCPMCRQQLNNEDLTPFNDGFLIDMLNELKIRCKLCQQSEIERGNFTDHISKACFKVNISCPSADIKCPWTGSRDQLNQHLNTCIFNPLRPLITELREQMHGQKTQTEQLKTQINGQQTQINRQQTEIEQLKSQMNQQLQNKIQPLESKFVDAACLRFLTSTIDFTSREKRRILKIPNPCEYNRNPRSTMRILKITGVQ